MHSNNWEKFSEAYIQATIEQRNFLDSDLSPLFLRKNLLKLSISNTLIREITLFCSSKILSLTNDADLESYLVQNELNVPKITEVINATLSLFVTESDYDRLSHQTIAHDVRKKLFSEATKTQQYLAFSNEGKFALAEIINKFNIFDIDTRKKVAILVTDIILGFYKIEDTVPLLQQELGVDARTAALFGADVLEFLEPLSNQNFIVPIEDSGGDLPAASNSIPTILSTSINNSTNDQIQLPVAAYQPVPTSAISPELHTMVMDAQAARTQFAPATEVTYSSEQPAISHNTLSDLPSYTTSTPTTPQNSTPLPPIEPPRWGV